MRTPLAPPRRPQVFQSPARLLCLLPILWSAAAAAAESVQAQLSATDLTYGQPVELILTAQGDQPAAPDLAVLERDFRILDRRVERRVAIRNGQRSEQVRLLLLLLPRRDGTLQVPPIPFGSLSTESLALTVRPDSGPPTETRPFAPPLTGLGQPPTSPVPPPWREQTSPSPAPPPANGANPWFWVSLGLAAALGAVLYTRRGAPRGPPTPAPTNPEPIPIAPLDAALDKVRSAYEGGDPHEARAALLAWAGLRWPETPPGNLARLARRCPPPLSAAINRLEMAFFSPEPIPWQQDQVVAELARMDDHSA